MLDRIVLAVLDRIVSYCIISDGSGNIGFYALAGYCLDGKDETDGLDWVVGGTGVGRTDISTRRKRSTTMGDGTGAPLLALERW